MAVDLTKFYQDLLAELATLQTQGPAVLVFLKAQVAVFKQLLADMGIPWPGSTSLPTPTQVSKAYLASLPEKLGDGTLITTLLGDVMALANNPTFGPIFAGLIQSILAGLKTPAPAKA